MRFQKIKYDGSTVALMWIEKKRGGDEDEHKLTSFQKPDVDLPNAMNAFMPVIFELLELPDSYADGFLVRGLSMNEEEADGRLGIVITCQKKLAGANAPLILNTPHLREPVGPDDGGKGFFPDKMLKLIEAAEHAAERFVEGARFQQDLFATSGGTK